MPKFFLVLAFFLGSLFSVVLLTPNKSLAEDDSCKANIKVYKFFLPNYKNNHYNSIYLSLGFDSNDELSDYLKNSNKHVEFFSYIYEIYRYSILLSRNYFCAKNSTENYDLEFRFAGLWHHESDANISLLQSEGLCIDNCFSNINIDNSNRIIRFDIIFNRRKIIRDYFSISGFEDNKQPILPFSSSLYSVHMASLEHHAKSGPSDKQWLFLKQSDDQDIPPELWELARNSGYSDRTGLRTAPLVDRIVAESYPKYIEASKFKLDQLISMNNLAD